MLEKKNEDEEGCILNLTEKSEGGLGKKPWAVITVLHSIGPTIMLSEQDS